MKRDQTDALSEPEEDERVLRVESNARPAPSGSLNAPAQLSLLPEWDGVTLPVPYNTIPY